MCTDCEYGKVRQDVADYESKLKINECVRANSEFRILTLNVEFNLEFRILILNFEFLF